MESYRLFLDLTFSRVEVGAVANLSMRFSIENAERGGWVAPHDLDPLIKPSGHALRYVLKSEAAVYE